MFYTLFYIESNIFLQYFLLNYMYLERGLFLMRYLSHILSALALFFAINACAQDTDVAKQETVEATVNANIIPATETPTENNINEVNADLEQLKAQADSGDVEAQLNLGYTYLYGLNGANIDYKQALAYYEAAAQQNNATAYNNLGSLYYNGIGTDVDMPKAISFFEKAAELGSSDAAVNLAVISLDKLKNDDTQEHRNQIFDLLKNAEKDNNIAKYLLGYCYLKGFLVKQNETKAFNLIKPAADDQYDEAQLLLAEAYINGTGIKPSSKLAVQYLEKATNQGNSLAMIQLADILAKGEVFDKDIKKAHKLYNIAATKGDKSAAQKRDALEENLSMEDLLTVQAEAENYTPEPSEKTIFIRQTFGDSLKIYIDSNLKTGD